MHDVEISFIGYVSFLYKQNKTNKDKEIAPKNIHLNIGSIPSIILIKIHKANVLGFYSIRE